MLSHDDIIQTVLLYSGETAPYEEILSLAQTMQEELQKSLVQEVTLGIGHEVTKLQEVNVSYKQSLNALEQRFFLGEGQVIHIHDIENAKYKEIFYPTASLGRILEALRIGNGKAVVQQVDDLFTILSKNSGLSLEYIHTLCLEILITANKYMLELKASDSRNSKFEYSWQQLFQLKTLVNTRDWLKTVLREMAESVSTLQNNTSRNIVELMKKIIRERFFENLTTQKLADEFYITPNYVCLLFKKEAGETFNDYLTRIRIDKAKELLKDTTLKLYEIAEKVGYQDVFYFSKLFKKEVGLSPSDYRDKAMV